MKAFLAVAAIAALAVGLASCDLQEPQTAVDAPDTFTGTVTRGVDGDTFWLDSRDASIRVFGLDAPETDEAGDSAAMAALTRLIGGNELTCRERDVDRYGRIVGQ